MHNENEIQLIIQKMYYFLAQFDKTQSTIFIYENINYND